jgi:hypothetical protein
VPYFNLGEAMKIKSKSQTKPNAKSNAIQPANKTASQSINNKPAVTSRKETHLAKIEKMQQIEKRQKAAEAKLQHANANREIYAISITKEPIIPARFAVVLKMLVMEKKKGLKINTAYVGMLDSLAGAVPGITGNSYPVYSIPISSTVRLNRVF